MKRFTVLLASGGEVAVYADDYRTEYGVLTFTLRKNGTPMIRSFAIGHWLEVTDPSEE